MLKSTVVDYETKQRFNIEYFDDDNVGTIRERIAIALDSHPDRLFILLKTELPADYYTSDKRRWEALFDRLSYNGSPITRIPFESYQTEYRISAISQSIKFEPYDRVEWMNYPESLKSLFAPSASASASFSEYRIFGVSDEKSFILPFEREGADFKIIPSTQIPLPVLSDIVPASGAVTEFLTFPYSEKYETVARVYYPLFRSSTLPTLANETVKLLNKNSKILEELLTLKNVPEPESVAILRTRFHIPFVDTTTFDNRGSLRQKFEQIFYGQTVSKDVPYIGLFTSNNEISRHKFYTDDTKNKTPFLDIDIWHKWWSNTKPVRSRPTLILYRGKSKTHFDRITFTSIDIVVSTYRPEKSTESLDALQNEIIDWMKLFDAINPFITDTDLAKERWVLQDLSFMIKYKNKLEEFDLRRFSCISNIFDIANKSKSQFNLLRTDHTNNGISSVEFKILQLIRDANGNTTAKNIQEELHIPLGDAEKLLSQVEQRIDEDPTIMQKALRGFPTLTIGPDFTIMSSTNVFEKSILYANMLRYVLSDPEDDDTLDNICPKKLETTTMESATIPFESVDAEGVLAEEYNDLFDYAEGNTIETETVRDSVIDTQISKIATSSNQTTLYNYFNNRLQLFDPNTFTSVGSLYPKKCEQKHQPIILSVEDQTRLKDTPYDPNMYLDESQITTMENPDGNVICPEYWCMKDQLPLQEIQLVHTGDSLACPVCKGKLRTSAKDNVREYTLIKREEGFVFPGFVDYKSPKTGKNMPCCFKRGKSKTFEKGSEDKYYILGETKSQLDIFRIAFIPDTILKSLRIDEDYDLIIKGGKRLQSGMSGFFRVGTGNRSSQSIPELLKLKTKIPSPKEVPEIIKKCSFFNSWKVGTSIDEIINAIDTSFKNGELTHFQEIEYTCLILNCDIFRITTASVELECMFQTQMVRPRSRGIILLDNDILSHVSRLPRGFDYHANIFDIPFKKETQTEVEKLRNTACITTLPSYNDILKIVPKLLADAGGEADFQIIVDPFERGQAIIIKKTVILPFKNIPLPDVGQYKLKYADITDDDLPSYDDEKKYLDSTKISGLEWSSDVYNSKGEIVEIITKSGLRVPVIPVATTSTIQPDSAVIETVRELGEDNLVFAKSSEEISTTYKNTSYQSEIFEFMLYQLTTDIEEDYTELRYTLQEIFPKQKEVEPLLQDWFDNTANFMNIDNPTDFFSKIRTPCGQFTSKDTCASANLCSWNPHGKCGVKISDKIIKKDVLFNRILNTIVENSKIRAMILDGRTSPFFSTILYLELPNERIMTDLDIVNI